MGHDPPAARLHRLGLGHRTLVMGVLNVTPDSFSDGGRYDALDAAVRRAEEMAEQGADIIDVGGESTRPATFRDQAPLDPAEERRRVIPVLDALSRRGLPALLSIDTYKPDVAAAAVDAGAAVLNDISGIGYEPPRMAELAAASGAALVVMHLPGSPHDIAVPPAAAPEGARADDLMAQIAAQLMERVALARSVGVTNAQIVLDPGIGFGKDAAGNAEIIRRLGELRALGFPLLSGPSRKGFLGALMRRSPGDPAPLPGERLPGSAAAVALSIAHGADIVRVHDVAFLAPMARVCDALKLTSR